MSSRDNNKTNNNKYSFDENSKNSQVNINNENDEKYASDEDNIKYVQK